MRRKGGLVRILSVQNGSDPFEKFYTLLDSSTEYDLVSSPMIIVSWVVNKTNVVPTHGRHARQHPNNVKSFVAILLSHTVLPFFRIRMASPTESGSGQGQRQQPDSHDH
jgi:hypothetical protein